jgi:hypothetical protein
VTLVHQEFQKVNIQTNSVLHFVLTLLRLLTFLKEDCEAREAVKSLWAEVRHLSAWHIGVVLLLLLLFFFWLILVCRQHVCVLVLGAKARVPDCVH